MPLKGQPAPCNTKAPKHIAHGKHRHLPISGPETPEKASDSRGTHSSQLASIILQPRALMASILSPFRLLDLPAELRVMIYEYTFGDNGPKDLDFFDIQDHYPSHHLLATTRQIYREAHQTYKQATEFFFKDKKFYITITKACTDQDHMKSICRRLSRHRFKNQHTIRLRFTGLKGYKVGGYAQIDLSLAPGDAHVPLIVSIRNGLDGDRLKTPIQIIAIANVFVRGHRETLKRLQVGDGLDYWAAMAYLGAVLTVKEELAKMWMRSGSGSTGKLG